MCAVGALRLVPSLSGLLESFAFSTVESKSEI